MDAPPAPPPRSPLRQPPPATTADSSATVTTLESLPSIDSVVSKRQHALYELLSSERAYASDLTLILEVHIPLAQGPMTPDDIKIIFGNIADLAELSDAFCEALERTMGKVEVPYKQYITRHPTALAHLTALPSTPELTAYHAKTRDLASSLSHAWDLASLLIKPVQRLLKYSLLLGAIIDATAATHPDLPHLKSARTAIEQVAHAVNEGRRRAEVVKEVLSAPRKPPTVLRIKSFRAPADVNSEAARVDRMSNELARIDVFAQQLSRGAQEWARAADTSTHALLSWARAFAAAIGLSPTVRSEAFDAFLGTLTEGLVPVAAGLLPKIASDLLAPLARLLATAAQPRQLLVSMNEHAPLHHHLLTMTVSAKNRPPQALMDASARYLALRTQLAAELPAYLSLLHKGLAAIVRRLAAVQAAFFFDTREVWAGLWDMLRVEGERNGGGEETIGVWRSRWGDVDQGIKTLKICQALPARISQTITAPPMLPPVAAGGLTAAEAYALAHTDPINSIATSSSTTLYDSPTRYERNSSSSASMHSGMSSKSPVAHVPNVLSSLEPGNRRSGASSGSGSGSASGSAAGAFMGAMQASYGAASGGFSYVPTSPTTSLSPSSGRPRVSSDATSSWTGFPGWNAPLSSTSTSTDSRVQSPAIPKFNGSVANGKSKRSNSPTGTNKTSKTMREGGEEFGDFVADVGFDYGGMMLPPKKVRDVEREEEKAREKARKKERKEQEERERAKRKEEEKNNKKKKSASADPTSRAAIASSRLALLEGGGYGVKEKSGSKSSKKSSGDKDKGIPRRPSDLANGSNGSSSSPRSGASRRPSTGRQASADESFPPFTSPRAAPLPPPNVSRARGRSPAPPPVDEDFKARRSTWLAAPTQYSCRVVHPCTPPSAVSYFGFPFFALEEHAILGVLHEAGHPSTHPRLPLYVDDGEDCLLLCRDSSNEIGWALASFLAPLAAD
ncbi:DH domain-containing protein [Mycena chlorophos]|uniref:DH domain-containing protein n=1 Tax=Mycena chlorophos TaxID=658473 RepID=A0A8H6VU23_MYCCL|nr:DH domain-containing protein [Mycena chlorophos]